MSLQRMRQDRAVEKIHDAVEEAMQAEMTPQEFMESARESWRIVHEDRARADDSTWRSLIEKK